MSASANKYKLITNLQKKSFITEAYRVLRTNIQFSSLEQQVKTIMVTSTYPSEGKSTTISNLAITFAKTDKKILLIDSDLHNPTLHRIFLTSNRVGLTNILTNQCSMQDAIVELPVPNLSILPSGTLMPNSAELLGSSRMEQLLSNLKPLYDLILIDSPPILAVSDSQILSTFCDGTLFVIKHGKVKRAAAQKALACLHNVRANVLGVVLNHKKRTKEDLVYYY